MIKIENKFNKSIVIGTGKLALACASILCSKNIECKVYEYNSLNYSQLERLCKKRCIEYTRFDKSELTQFLKNIEEPLLVISANNTYIFPPDVVEKSNLSIINFHPALLPKFPGRNAEAWCIFSGEEKSGITWHIVDKEIDHGKIIIQDDIKLGDKITSLELMFKQFEIAEKAFEKIADTLILKTFNNKLQINNMNKLDIHYAKDIPNGGELDIKWSIKMMSQFLRAMDYGSLKILGSPFLLYNEKKYIWDKYIVTTNDNPQKIIDVEKGLFSDGMHSIQLCNIRIEPFIEK